MIFNSAAKKGSLLRRYNRLLNKYSTYPNELSLAQIAETLACTSRYARSLLNEMQEEGWLAWSSRPGRGALGVLQCRMNTAALQTLLAGEYPAAETKNAPATVETRASEDGYRYVISFYRPLLTPVPSVHVDRAGRHVLQMVHDGLMRHLPEQREPVPGLAHTVRVSDDGLCWRFMLRRGLVWHNGEPVAPEQLLAVLQRYVGGPGLPHVVSATLRGHVLTLTLRQPDIMLPWRLANPVYALPHPENGSIGLGPFRVSEHNNTRMVLLRAANWYGETPQAAEVTFNTPLNSLPLPFEVHLDTPRSLLTPDAVTCQQSADAFYYLFFNMLRARLSPEQQKTIRVLTRSISAAFIENEKNAAPLPEWMREEEESYVETKLPATLNLIYFRSPKMTRLVGALEKSLSYRGCRLNVTPVNVTHWLLQDNIWEEQDICFAFMRFGHYPEFSMEERFRHSVIWRWFWGTEQWQRAIGTLDMLNAGPAAAYHQRIQRLLRFMIRRSLIVPQFLQRYRLMAPPSIQGISCYSQSWPDFTRLWTDEPDTEEDVATDAP
ncbi:SgrR family transcriptional regulator [Kosakonia sp. MUSA4]|uniref:SgrR family transcriptional regulator n=1 Tax=Kosakonia sp. MUSA4 TaxID=2067958 RepID=UPI00159ABFAC|nr:SgrR family transcriptional regulator [Kosakonia sp. MUSA4]QJT82131.1 ABC transporter substrate-binding protein [Kosakonia sp. MUSA4]